MHTDDLAPSLAKLFSELIEGAPAGGQNFMLNAGDAGMLASLDHLSTVEASAAVHDGATIAAHAQHVRYGLSLMNAWAQLGGNPFADATWDAAWKVGAVDDAQWGEIRAGLREEARRWLAVLGAPREVHQIEYAGMISSIGHVAYHLGAMRQIAKGARGPKEGTFQQP